MKKSRILLLVSVLPAAGLALLLVRARAVELPLPRTGAVESRYGDEVEALRREASRLERLTGAALGAKAAALSSDSTRAAPPPADSTPRPPPTPEALEAAEAAAREASKAKFRALDDHFLGESVDSPATQETKSKLKAALLTHKIAGVEIGAFECRRTLCRARLALAPSQNEAVIPAVFTGISAISGGTLRVEPQAQGGKAVEVFLARAGHRLPLPQPDPSTSRQPAMP